MGTSPNSRAGAVRLGIPLMILSFLAVAGFLYWLSVTAGPTETEMAVEAEPDEVQATEVALGDFFAGPPAYMGQYIALREIPVTQLLGSQSFWTNPPGSQAPYLVHLSAALLADSVAVNVGALVDVTGTVLPMSESVLANWDSAGAFPGGESDRVQASFAENFIEVTRIEEVESSEPSS